MLSAETALFSLLVKVVTFGSSGTRQAAACNLQVFPLQLQLKTRSSL
jgi:hypothetical protein